MHDAHIPQLRRKLRTVFKNIVMILMISGVAVTRQRFSPVKENV